MAAENFTRDQNHVTVLGGVTDDANLEVRQFRVDPATNRLLVSAVIAGSENGKILVSADDTTYNYLELKLVAGAGITLTTLNPGGDETLEISSAAALGYYIVQDNGVAMTQRSTLNFVNYFTLTDDAPDTRTNVSLNITELEPALDLANLSGQIDLTTQVTGLLPSTNIDLTDLESSLDLANIAGQIDLTTQVSGLLPAANIDIADLESVLDLGNLQGQIDLTSQVTGALPVANGGTGATTLTGVLHGNGTSAVTAVPLTTDGAILIGDGATAPTTLAAFTSATGNLKLANGGTGASLSDPGADRIMFWDDSAGAVTWLTAGSGLTITDTTITATGSSIFDTTYINIQYPFSMVNSTDAVGNVWAITGTSTVNPSILDIGTGDVVNISSDQDGILPDTDNTGGDCQYQFDSNTQAVFQCVVWTHTGGANNKGGVGFCGIGLSPVSHQGTNTLGVNFTRDAAGAWYARCATGAAFTETAITISAGAKHILRCEYDPGNVTPQARFYVDDNTTPVATITTNVPNAVDTKVGWGAGNDAVTGQCIDYVTCPAFAAAI